MSEEFRTKTAINSTEIILRYCHKKKLLKSQIAYILATAIHESKLGNWMVEKSSGQQYEGRKSLGNTVKGDGVKFKGRGFVQLTGRVNYTFWSKRLQLDLLSDPDLVTIPENAKIILVDGMLEGTFTGKKLPDYINAKKTDYVNARKVINGLDNANHISTIAKNVYKIL